MVVIRRVGRFLSRTGQISAEVRGEPLAALSSVELPAQCTAELESFNVIPELQSLKQRSKKQLLHRTQNEAQRIQRGRLDKDCLECECCSSSQLP